jgi:LysM repeat protein
MSSPEDLDKPGSYATGPKRRRRFSIWTLLAPAAAVILWISFFSALGSSCIFKECSKDSGSDGAQTVASGDERNDLARDTKAKIKDGDTLGSIAAKYKLTEEELKACNPLVDPQALQAGRYLVVSAVNCEEADKAETGANPDPLAGDTTTGAGSSGASDPNNNGTAAADPSVKDAGAASGGEGSEN